MPPIRGLGLGWRFCGERSVDNFDDNVFIAVNINIYNAIYQRICYVNEMTKTPLSSVYY